MDINQNLKWWADRDEWDKVWGTKEIEIVSVKLFNSLGRENNCIRNNGDLTVRVKFCAREDVKKPHFGIALFREDGLYCFGPNTALDGYNIGLVKKGKGWFSITFEKIPFTPGSYRVSTAIWDKKEVLPYSYHPGRYRFEIAGPARQFVLDIAHKWKTNTPMPENLEPKQEPIEPDTEILMRHWKKEIKSSEIAISHIETSNEFGIRKEVFEQGRRIFISVYIDSKVTLSKDYYLWVAIFRKDQLYCHALTKRLYSDKKITLIYPSIPLLTGDYRISAAIFNKRNSSPMTLCHGLHGFKVICKRNYHGLAHIKHRWKWALPR
jgi:hypothetical protein